MLIAPARSLRMEASTGGAHEFLALFANTAEYMFPYSTSGSLTLYSHTTSHGRLIVCRSGCYRSIKVLCFGSLMPDLLHPNREGMRALGMCFNNALDEQLQKS